MTALHRLTALNLVLAAAGPAFAHARLVASDPPSGAVVAAPGRLVLHFSEPLQPMFSGVSLTMPGMGNMAVAVATAYSDDATTLTATPQAPLARGRYRLSWHAATADTHRTEGKVEFVVR